MSSILFYLCLILGVLLEKSKVFKDIIHALLTLQSLCLWVQVTVLLRAISFMKDPNFLAVYLCEVLLDRYFVSSMLASYKQPKKCNESLKV